MKEKPMRRRDVIALLGGAAAPAGLLPRAVKAQQPAIPVVGYLGNGSPEATAHLVAAFRKGLSETSYVEGQNVAIEFRWTHNDNNRLPELAADLVRRRVAVMAAPGSIATALAAKAATATIPIVFSAGADPVQMGLVASLNRPGGNVTGVSTMNNELVGKQIGLLHELLPGAERYAALVNSNNPASAAMIMDARTAVAAIGRQIEVLTVSTNGDIDAAFASLMQKRVEALLVAPDPLFTNRRVQLQSLATRHAVPTIFSLRENAEAGGLMSYGSSITDLFRQTGIYVGRILKGEKPSDLPVMRATRFEFIINLQTARTLGIDVPPGLLAIADEVIE
jgi:putative tryptophan/tyrosine transport system substrate-binding protein